MASSGPRGPDRALIGDHIGARDPGDTNPRGYRVRHRIDADDRAAIRKTCRRHTCPNCPTAPADTHVRGTTRGSGSDPDRRDHRIRLRIDAGDAGATNVRHPDSAWGNGNQVRLRSDPNRRCHLVRLRIDPRDGVLVRMETQMAPPPAAAWPPGSTGIRATIAFVLGSIRVSVEVWSLIAHTAPSPTAKPPTPSGMAIFATTCLRAGDRHRGLAPP